MKNDRPKRRASLLERLELRLSRHMHVDGLWVGTYEREPRSLLRRVEEALHLIKTYDRLRYERITRDLKRVWVRTLFGNLANFNEAVDACELDARFVLATTSDSAIIASAIVHEATHARLIHCGIPYEEKLRARVEAVCFRRELAFAKNLPNGAEVRERAQTMLELTQSNAHWTNTTLDQRYVDGAIEAAHYAGMPRWLARMLLALRAFFASMKRLILRNGPSRPN